MIIITQGRYTGEAIAAMAERPEDRSKEARRLIEAAGGKFIASYFTFGEYDFLVISEFDDIRQVTPALIAVAAGGALSLLPHRIVEACAAAAFLAGAVLLWRQKGEDKDEEEDSGRDGLRSGVWPVFSFEFGSILVWPRRSWTARKFPVRR